MNFKQYIENHPLTIKWNTKLISPNWIDRTTGKRHIYSLEYINLSKLKPHETPSKKRVNQMVKLMKSDALISLISIGSDGIILDGHARYYAAQKILGNDAIIPVEASSLITV